MMLLNRVGEIIRKNPESGFYLDCESNKVYEKRLGKRLIFDHNEAY